MVIRIHIKNKKKGICIVFHCKGVKLYINCEKKDAYWSLETPYT